MGSASSVHPATHLGQDIVSVIKFMLPIYYIEESVTAEEIAIGKKTWNFIVDDTSVHFNQIKAFPEVSQTSCISFFYDSFYARLFDVHPMAKPLFKAGLKTQGKFLVKLMTLAVSLLGQQDKFRDIMVRLAESHNDLGVKSVEYGIVGEVLFWTLRRCLGPAYDSTTHRVWVKIMCRMLTEIVPVAVAFEMQCGDAQYDRMNVRESSIRKPVLYAGSTTATAASGSTGTTAGLASPSGESGMGISLYAVPKQQSVLNASNAGSIRR